MSISRLATVQILLSLVVIAALSACNDAPKQMSMPPSEVQISAVSNGLMADKSEYIATMKSRKSITLSPKVDGIVNQIWATSGQAVKSGQKIMQIDCRMQSAQADALRAAADSMQSDLDAARDTLASLQSSLKSKQANVDYTKAQHERYVTLQKEGAVAVSDLDSWRNNYTGAVSDRDAMLQQIEAQKMTVRKYERSHAQALSNLQAQNEQLKYYAIVAPFNGVVGDIPVKVGDLVSPSTALTSLTENHPLEAYISVPAEKTRAIHLGTPVALSSRSGTKYGDSRVSFIAPTVDSSSQTVLIKTLYPNGKDELRADQIVTAQLVWSVQPGILVPTQAVSQAAGKYFVYVAQGQGDKLVAHQVEIQVNGIEGSSYQVSRGLKHGDRIVLTGIQRLADGAPITAKPSVGDQVQQASAKSQIN